MLPKSRRLRGTNGRYHPWLPLDDQPGYCYLRLFKKELRELIDWPAFPTLLEIFQWEVELRDDRAMVGLVKMKGRTVWHVEGRGDLSWAHLTKMKEDMGHILLGADQRSYAAVAARVASRRLTRADTRILFGRNTDEEWYNESFRWLVEGMPRAHWNIETWRQTVHRCSELPPIRDPSLWINRIPNEVPKVRWPGYCYLTLFKEEYHEAFDWPAFPTWSEVALWDENLRREGKFRVMVKGKLWHIEEDEIRGESWMMV